MLKLAAITHRGFTREFNEDNFCFLGTNLEEWHSSMPSPITGKLEEDEAFVVGVFDGLGGERFGAKASYMVSKLFAEREISNLESFEQAFQDANKMIRLEKATRKASIGTTATVLFYDGARLYLGYAGDTRAFVLRDLQLTRLSKDHTNRDLLNSMGLSNAQISMTKYIGVGRGKQAFKPTIRELDIKKNDILLLASDGLTDELEETDMAELLELACPIEKKVALLCEQALTNGGRDNITVVACEACD